MANYVRRTVITQHFVYELTLPSDRDEIYKALSGASNDWSRLHPEETIPANAFLIKSDGEKLTISFEIDRREE